MCVLQGLGVCPSGAGYVSFRGWMCVLQGLDVCSSGAGCVCFRGLMCVLQGLDVCPLGAGCVPFRCWMCVLQGLDVCVVLLFEPKYNAFFNYLKLGIIPENDAQLACSNCTSGLIKFKFWQDH